VGQANFKAKIPANKFYPPRFDASQSLYRKHLVEDILWKRGNSKQVILIEAQAGQGKTTLLQQYLDRYKLPYAWYQIGREDRDPILLVAALLDCLSRALPSFSAPELEKRFASGQVSAKDLGVCINILLQHLGSILRHDFLIVFDDLHLLQDCAESLSALKLLTETAPPFVRFAFAARRPSGLDFRGVFSVGKAIHLDNLQIALRREEAYELFHSVLHMDIPGATLNKLYQATDGWTMGLVLAAHSLESEKGCGGDQRNPVPLAQEDFLVYFRQEVYGQLPEQARESLLLLCQLDEIPVDLARLVAGRPDVDAILAELQGRNFFVRRLDEQGRIFGLHHLFQEFLQDRARQELPAATISRVFRQAASYFQDHGQPLKALDYAIQAQDYDGVEDLLNEEGAALLVLNRTQSLAASFGKIPAEEIAARGWLTLFAGIMAMEGEKTEKALPPLEKACELFMQKGEQKGELMARSQVCWYHLMSSGLYNEGVQHLAAARELYGAMAESLADIEKILVARNISGPCLLFVFDREGCELFASIGIELARKQGLTGILVTLYASHFYVSMFSGRLQQAIAQFEELFLVAQGSDLGISSRMMIQTAEVNLLESLGELEGYGRMKARVNELTGKALLAEFLLGPYFLIWDITLDITWGRFNHGRELLRKYDAHISALNPHYRSQVIQKGAYLLSLIGDHDTARAWMNEAKKLREITGGPYFAYYQALYAGAACCQLGLTGEAEERLDEAVNALQAVGNEFLMASALLHRAWLFMQTGSMPQAEKDLARALASMRRNGFTYLRALPPAIMETLLCEAVKKNIEADYARLLAREWQNKAILDDGTVIPLLQIQFLGNIEVCFEDKLACSSEKMTPVQRELLTLLAASPGHKISQERVQLLLWPESPPDKARANFDTLLSRCRKILADTIPKKMVQHYLVLQKGILALKNCRVDAWDFLGKAGKGIKHSRQREYWQADNAFYSAMKLWQGVFAPEVFGSADEVELFRESLLALFCEASLSWSENQLRFKQQHAAVSTLRTALNYDPLNERLNKRLYLLLYEQSCVQAQQFLDGYRNSLARAEYEPEEIEEAVNRMVASTGT